MTELFTFIGALVCSLVGSFVIWLGVSLVWEALLAAIASLRFCHRFSKRWHLAIVRLLLFNSSAMTLNGFHVPRHPWDKWEDLGDED